MMKKQFKTIEAILDEVFEKWKCQKEKAILADKLLEECEALEEEMLDLLKEAKEIYPEGYEAFLKAFEGEIPRIEEERRTNEN